MALIGFLMEVLVFFLSDLWINGFPTVIDFNMITTKYKEKVLN